MGIATNDYTTWVECNRCDATTEPLYNGVEAVRLAKRQNWFISSRTGSALCPRCRKVMEGDGRDEFKSQQI